MKAGENLEIGCLAMVVKIRDHKILGHTYGEIVKCLDTTELLGKEYWFVEGRPSGCRWWHPASGLLRLPDLDDSNEENCAILPKTPPKINNSVKEII